MGRATCISLLFLLLVVVLEIWVFFMETNRRVKALRLHVIAVQELFVCATSWYIWKRVRYVFKSGNSLSISTAVRIACILLLVFAQACIVAGNALVYREPTHLTRISKTCLGVVLFIGTCLAITDVFSLSVRALCCRGNEWREVLSVKTEIKWRTFLALVAAAALTFAGVIGMSQFTVEKLTIPIKGLHPRLNGTTIVQLSDIHLGGFNGRSALQHIVSEVNQLNPDVVVVTGDLVDGPVSSLREIVEPLRDIESKYGVYLATGNHEYYTGDVDNWISELPKYGVTPLINSRVCLLAASGRDGGECVGGLYLAGLEDIATRMGIYGPHSMDLDAALKSRTQGTPTIVLAHQPKAALEAAQWSDVRLVLSGHTHAGQFFPSVTFVYFFNPLFVGLYEPSPGVFVYVNPGTLYYVVPFRHYRPEITYFTLQSISQ